MDEEITKYMKRVLDEIQDYDEDCSLDNAKKLNLDLTVMKAMMKPEQFDELDSFRRYLAITSRQIDKDMRKDAVKI